MDGASIPSRGIEAPPVSMTAIMSEGGLRASLRDNRREWIAAGVWVVVALAVFVLAAPLASFGRFGPGPGLFPRLTAAALLVLALVRIAELFRPRRLAMPVAGAASGEGEEDEERVGGRWAGLRFVAMAASLFAYPALLRPVGFVTATTALGWTIAVLLGRRPLRALVEIAAAVLVLRYAFTDLLGVRLPLAEVDFLRVLGL